MDGGAKRVFAEDSDSDYDYRCILDRMGPICSSDE